MLNKLFFLFRKELSDYIHSYKCWGTLFLVSCFPLLFHAKGKEMPDLIYLLFFQGAQAQCIYDSFLTDTKEKGMLFYHNLSISFPMMFFTKFITSLIIPFIAAVINTKDMVLYFSFSDILWILPVLIFSETVAFAGAVVSAGAEMFLELLTVFFGGAVFILCRLSPFGMRIGIPIILSVLMIAVDSWLYQSKFYRKQV